MKIAIDKKYISNGQNIRLICIDRPNTTYPILGMFDDGSILSFDENGTYVHGGVNNNLIEVWEPQKGEWCWFWDYTEQSHVCLDRFDRVDGFGSFLSNAGVYWLHCAKFSNELPEHLKEKPKEPVYEWQYVIIYNGVATITEEFFTEQEFWDTHSSSDFIDTAYAIERTARIRK
jgi:hypothetical protein